MINSAYDNYLTSDFERAEEEAAILEEARDLICEELIDSGSSAFEAGLQVKIMSNNAVRAWIINNKEEQY